MDRFWIMNGLLIAYVVLSTHAFRFGQRMAVPGVGILENGPLRLLRLSEEEPMPSRSGKA